ncbi:indole-3-glycerol phosphate synthase TrpC [Clostridium chromiireducens]|uniref:Indole-3-glycerol phosphate synthase n=1 Tax=Clostridium chromiireducens TaxID=225345 RepID=A0A1V4I847_9CLOT|nr:indole-3-glycerol phosphate synthase TrpC [Clostridium chromiireducens]MVX66015.1 indole-3-glycerol phosphate synthase TrpC [Clostridium chromiireducens]OPJ56136.1 indole-3-glycerol phosphate synthase [Clostridium chromiireducens]
MILDDIVEMKKIRVAERKKEIPIKELEKQALSKVNDEKESNVTNPFLTALKKEGLSVIGEFKKASPSKGVIVEEFNIKEILNYYTYLGIDVFSILTEEDFFLGCDEYLKEIRKISYIPILRKDFIIDFYQIYEAKVLGANGILLIASVLGENLGKFYKEAKRFNLEPLVEVHNKEELDLALKYDCEIIGINNRDLKTFHVSLDTTKELIQYIPKEKIIIAESGIMSIEDLDMIKKYGADGVLIGELFMRNIDNSEFKTKYKEFRSNK